MRRELDGTYFRFGNDDICFSDLNEKEQDTVLKGRSKEWLKSLCKHLAQVLKEIGDQFDITGSDEGESDA